MAGKRRVFVVLGAVLVAAVAGLAVFVATFTPKARATTSLAVGRSPESVARGEYLATKALGCMGCHTARDWKQYGAPFTGPMGAGGFCMGAEYGFPGKLCVPNITSDPETGLGSWSDDEILRAVREGIDRHGVALFPMMPYQMYKNVSDEDAHALVAYLRTLPPVKNAVPAAEIDFPVSFFIKMAPEPLVAAVKGPPRGATAEYGKYLVSVAGCQTCHTPVDDHHAPLPGKEFHGGQEHVGPWGRVITPNITMHPTAGIGALTEEAFIALFKGKVIGGPPPEGRNTVMPWLEYRHLDEADLRAIYAYLKTVHVSVKKIDAWPAAKS